MGIKQFSNPQAGYVNKYLRSLNFDSTGKGGARKADKDLIGGKKKKAAKKKK